jgi:hypothetical protein
MLQEEVDHLLKLIASHRNTARVYDKQIADLGNNAAPYMSKGADEARDKIRQIKTRLLTMGLQVTPDVVDESPVDVKEQLLDDLEAAIRGFNLNEALEIVNTLRQL